LLGGTGLYRSVQNGFFLSCDISDDELAGSDTEGGEADTTFRGPPAHATTDGRPEDSQPSRAVVLPMESSLILSARAAIKSRDARRQALALVRAPRPPAPT